MIDVGVRGAVRAPTVVSLTRAQARSPPISQLFLKTTTPGKLLLLISLIPEPHRVVVFCNSLLTCSRLTAYLKLKGVDVGRKGRVIIGTDGLGRGVNLGVGRVVNYDAPTSVQSYVHRAGRTGRAGAKGQVYTFFREGEDIKKFTVGVGRGGKRVKVEEREEVREEERVLRRLGEVLRGERGAGREDEDEGDDDDDDDEGGDNDEMDDIDGIDDRGS